MVCISAERASELRQSLGRAPDPKATERPRGTGPGAPERQWPGPGGHERRLPGRAPDPKAAAR